MFSFAVSKKIMISKSVYVSNLHVLIKLQYFSNLNMTVVRVYIHVLFQNVLFYQTQNM